DLGVKQRAPVLARVALALVLMRFVEILWLVAPSFDRDGFAIHWLDVVAPIGIGGIWLWFFVRQLARLPVLPIGDPALPRPDAHAEGHACPSNRAPRRSATCRPSSNTSRTSSRSGRSGSRPSSSASSSSSATSCRRRSKSRCWIVRRA